MSFRPKLIASDLDGTIVAHYGEITERTINAFRTAHDMGVEIFFVTGRPPRWMPEIKEAFGIGKAICGNGAQLFDLQNQIVIEEWLIPVNAQIETVKKLRKAIPQISFASEAHNYFHREKKYVPRWDVGLDNIGVDDITEIMTLPSLKLLVHSFPTRRSSDDRKSVV